MKRVLSILRKEKSGKARRDSAPQTISTKPPKTKDSSKKAITQSASPSRKKSKRKKNKSKKKSKSPSSRLKEESPRIRTLREELASPDNKVQVETSGRVESAEIDASTDIAEREDKIGELPTQSTKPTIDRSMSLGQLPTLKDLHHIRDDVIAKSPQRLTRQLSSPKLSSPHHVGSCDSLRPEVNRIERLIERVALVNVSLSLRSEKVLRDDFLRDAMEPKPSRPESARKSQRSKQIKRPTKFSPKTKSASARPSSARSSHPTTKQLFKPAPVPDRPVRYNAETDTFSIYSPRERRRTVPVGPTFATEKRMQHRKDFDKLVAVKQARRECEEELNRLKREEEEAKEIRRLRQTMQFKATPIRKYKPFKMTTKNMIDYSTNPSVVPKNAALNSKSTTPSADHNTRTSAYARTMNLPLYERQILAKEQQTQQRIEKRESYLKKILPDASPRKTPRVPIYERQMEFAQKHNEKMEKQREEYFEALHTPWS